jgi:hypothetical protein
VNPRPHFEVKIYAVPLPVSSRKPVLPFKNLLHKVFLGGTQSLVFVTEMGFQESAPFGADTTGNLFNTFVSTNGEPVPSPSQFPMGSNSHNGGNAGSSLPSRPETDTPQVPVAIVGMGCKLPGGNSSPSKLWDFLYDAKSSWAPKAPRDRFNWDAFTHPTDPDFDGTFQIAGGHFHGEDVDLSRFDSAFFGLPLSEARIMDPQQRLLLEVSYECLETGGIPMEAVAGRKVGCFVAFSMGGKSTLINDSKKP